MIEKGENIHTETCEVIGSHSAINRMRSPRMRGRVFMLGSAISFSTIAFFTRLINLPLAEMLFLRGISGALIILAVVYFCTSHKMWGKAIFNGPSMMVVILFTIGMFSLVMAYRIGSVIDVAIIYGTIPIWVGMIEWCVWRRLLSKVFWFSTVAVILGICIMNAQQISHQDFIGMALAGLMTICVSGIIIISRQYPAVSLLPASGIASFMSALLAFPFISSFVLSWLDIFLSLIFGIFTIGIGRIFLLLGSRLIPAHEAALIDVLDAPLSPMWTLFLGIIPSIPAICGAGIIIIAVILGVYNNRDELSAN